MWRTDGAAALNAQMGEALTSLGRTGEAWRHFVTALASISPTWTPDERMATYFLSAQLCLAEALPETALYLQRMHLAEARRSSNTAAEGEALLALARSYLRLGRMDDAQTLVHDGLAAAAGGGGEAHRAFVAGELRAVLLESAPPSDPHERLRLARQSLDYATRARRSNLLPRLYLLEARAHRLVGSQVAAKKSLWDGIHEFERQLTATPAGLLQIAFRDTGWPLYEELALEELEEGDGADAALEALDRGRVVFSGHLAGVGKAARASAVEQPVLYLQTFPDRLCAWLLRPGERPRFHETRISSQQISLLAATTVASIAAGVDAGPALLQLSDLLLAPFRDDLRDVDALDVIASSPLDVIPWTALSHPAFPDSPLLTRMTVRLRSALRPIEARSPDASSPNAPVVVLGRGAPTVGDAPLLPNAEREAQQVAALYPAAQFLDGGLTTKNDILAAIRGASVLHFAGHGFLSAVDEARSALILDAAVGSVLTGRDIGAQPLKASLAVLVACRTGQGRASGSSGSVSLARLFLVSGAQAVIATLGDVDDRWASMLSVALHREMAAGTDPAAALRTAQLSIYESHPRDPAHVRNWAFYSVLIGTHSPSTREGS